MILTVIKAGLYQWHRLLDLPRQSPPSWYPDRLRDEIQELREARTFLERLSETADVFFTISRSEYDGFPVGQLPDFNLWHVPVYLYLIGKFTSRWTFYKVAAFICKPNHGSTVREVTNPTKDFKMEDVARRHGLDPTRFKRIGRNLRRVWPLFP
ncbi:hypothetical protein GGR53DRAFT_529402 [Hypoxylon sp. FL1150]|nr:hypothetical protein GGR53DRAFT_529402 [Hypoxylon sp. FL1150]